MFDTLPHEIDRAAERMAPHILHTPVEYSPWLSRETGAEVWLKLEHLQITGSFKLRGATHKVLSLTPAQRAAGVVTASTGNHGAAVAHIASRTGCPATIYLPHSVSQTKVDYLSLFEVTLRYAGADSVETEQVARAAAAAAGQVFISPYNDWEVITGQGTIGREVLAQVPDLDAVLVPVGGGGLIAGIAGYLKARQPALRVVGCQPINSAVMYHSVQAGEILDLPSQPTLSDGTAGGLEAGSLTFPACQRYVDDWALISEPEIRAALRYLLEKHYLLVEGSAALTVAALRQDPSRWQGQRVVLILCGRKLGLDTLREVVTP